MGDASGLTIRLALLFLPGIISALLVEKLVPTSEWSTARLALYSLVLGLGSYLTYALAQAAVLLTWPPHIDLLKSLASNSNQLDFTEIFLTTAISPFVGLLASLTLNRHWINRFAKAIRVSKKFGDLDVWANLFNSSNVNWVVVRDFEADLAYDGWVKAWSDTFNANEVQLGEVRVFKSSTSEFLYEVDSVYLTRAKDNLTIEIRSDEPLPKTPERGQRDA